MCFRHWNRSRGSPDVRNGFVRFNDPRRISSPRDSQKADGIMSRRSTVDSVIPLLVKGFTIHPQTFSLKMGPEEGIVASPSYRSLRAGFQESLRRSACRAKHQESRRRLGFLAENRETPLSNPPRRSRWWKTSRVVG